MNEYKHIIVAVHGIGDQSRNATVRSVATRFARMPMLAGDGIYIAPQALGYFHTDVRGAVKVAPLDKIDCKGVPLGEIGFSEVFWADIPQVVVNEGHTIEETKAWARTVMSRTRAVFKKADRKHRACKNKPNASSIQHLQLIEPDFTLAAEVLDEIIDTVYVLENLCFLADKAGVVKFDLRDVLEKYVGDVQIVTEFTEFRRDIVGRMHRAMEQIHFEHPNAKLHIVAHSEGTVVSFLGLLHALSGDRVLPAEDQHGPLLTKTGSLPSWVRQVQGFMTIGSPIDKHLLLWPELFDYFDLSQTDAWPEGQKIKWRNYYDYGDPVGFKLDTARKWFIEKKCDVFEFTDEDDKGFARYLWPGKAHNDYWNDPVVFEDFVREVIAPPPQPSRRSKIPTRPTVFVISPLLPYVAALVVLFAGTLLFYRQVSGFMNPPLDPVQSYVRLMTVGNFPSATNGWLRLLQPSVGITMLIVGTTLLARWPRLAKGLKWKILGALAFVAGCFSYWALVSPASRAAIGAGFRRFNIEPTWGAFLAAFVVAVVGLLAITKPAERRSQKADTPKLRQRIRDNICGASRRTRWFFKQMRPLIASGGIVAAAMVGFQIANPKPALTPDQRTMIVSNQVQWATNEMARARVAGAAPILTEDEIRRQAVERADNIQRLITLHPPVWPVALAGLAFLYLWWLATLIFELGFVWQRYVRRSVALDHVQRWRDVHKDCERIEQSAAPPEPTAATAA